MLGQWRLVIRKAEHAFKNGQLDRACAYVTAPEVRSYRQARELAGQVVEALALRAEEHIQQGDAERAWSDLAQAERLNGSNQALDRVRQKLVRCALDDAMVHLKGGQPEGAIECLDRLARRGVSLEEARRLHDGALAWRVGRAEARAGRFAQAIERLSVARGLLPDCDALETAAQEAWVGRDRITTLEPELHRALAAENWTEALAAADDILGLAPDHAQARATRRRAWQAVGAPVSAVRKGDRAVANHFADDPHAVKTVLRPPGSPLIIGEDRSVENPQDATGAGRRFLLWIDGVGGYLVCLGNRVSLGQPAGWQVDVPIMADLSRLHAWIERDGEGYLLRAVRPATVNGQPIRDKAVLADVSEIVLGSGVRLTFRRPSPLSTTARLELASPHRLALPTDAVLLMADTCVIGPKPGAHVVAPGWTREVVFYRQGEELWCRTAGCFEVDGQPCQDRARVTFSSRIRGDGFSLALESTLVAGLIR